MRGGGGRMSGGLGGSRASSGRGLGTTGGAGRAGRGMGTPIGGGAARPPVRGPVRGPAPRPVAPRRNPGFGAGVAVGMGMGRRRRGWGWGGGWGGGWGWRRRRRMMPMGMGPGPMMHGGHGGGGGGCAGMLTALFMLLMIVIVIAMFANMTMPFGTGMGWRGVTNSVQVTRSTVRREPLPRGSADTSVPMLVDHPGWIANQTVLNRGLNNFHDRTGVRPILYIVSGNINGDTHPSNALLESHSQQRYTELTRGNEAHVLVLIFENDFGDYGWWVTPGTQAAAVLDGEARDIILDYIARYWYGTLDEHDMFARAFDEASQRIMTVTRSQWIPVLVVVGVLLILLLLFSWWKRKQEQKNLEAEQTERILSQPLETIGSDSNDAASQLAQQYEDDNNN